MNQHIINLRNIIILAVCASFMPGCASESGQMAAIKPVYRMQDHGLAADYHYRLGKSYFAKAEYGLAIGAFQQALHENSKSILALNGLAACYDQLQRYEVAAGYYYKALQIEPDSARTLNNIGYSLLMQGRGAEAQMVLGLAANRAPADQLISRNLQLAKNSVLKEQRVAAAAVAPAAADKVQLRPAAYHPDANYVDQQAAAPKASGQCRVDIFSGTDRLQQARRLGAYLARHSGTTTCVTAAPAFDCERTIVYYSRGKQENAQLVASLLPVAAELQPSSGRIGTDVRVVPGDDIMHVALAPSQPAAAAAEHTTAVVPVPLILEVSNGNGRNGMARLLGNVLQAHGESVARVTNAGHFHFVRTVIYFAPGWRREAERLAASLPVKPQLIESDGIYHTINARIVLGADLLPFEKTLRNSLGIRA